MKDSKIAPLTRTNLHGVWCALIVPWTDRDELDERRFVQECRSYGGTGVHGIYTGGTTGEFYAQDDATYERITKIAVEHAHDVGLPIQIGCSALSTRTARQRAKVAIDAGADALQIAIPFWLTLKDDEVMRFMREIAEAAGDTPIILYTTERAKRLISPQLFGALAHEVPTFIGTKDTGCDVPLLKAILAEAPDIAVFGGDDDFYIKIPAGGRGGYCSVTGLNTARIVKYYELCAAGKLEEALPIYQEINRFMQDHVVALVTEDGLWDSAIDRLLRVCGGGDVGIRCQSPYRSGTQKHLDAMKAWLKQNAPALLPSA